MNEFLVGAKGGKLVIMRRPMELTGAEAVNLAAWLVAMSVIAPGGGKDAFDAAYREAISS